MVANKMYLPYEYALSKGLEGIEAEGKKLKIQCAQTQTKSLGQCNFLYDSYNIAKHISVHIVLSTLFVLNQKVKKSNVGRFSSVTQGHLSYPIALCNVAIKAHTNYFLEYC